MNAQQNWHAREAADAIKAGDTLTALLSGNFIFGDFLEALAVENGVRFKRLTLSTLAISDENVISLENMMETGFLERLEIVVSSYFWAHNRANVSFLYEHLCDTHGAKIAVAGIHTKIALIETEKTKILVHGSANMRSSRTLETVTVEQDDALFDFHDAWHQQILTDYQVTKKERRASNLWSLVGEET
jgi:hypothetical protein